jgi:probable F420-dependent oxidoreductase
MGYERQIGAGVVGRVRSSTMKIYANTGQRTSTREIAEHARRAERIGYDGLNVPEAVHDGLLLSALALQATSDLHVATSVLVAFTRSPMTTAVAAWDLQELSRGRFELGLGAQIRPKVEDRYGMPWSPPIGRMEEFVHSLRAIFACWQDGVPLHFEGRHYRLTRMQPFFARERLHCAPVPILLGAVGPRMTQLAGEVADGLVTHPTNTHPRYLREVILPRLAEGAARQERHIDNLRLSIAPICVAARDRKTLTRRREDKRRSLAFLFSTPAYWPSLELFGWGDRGPLLRERTRQNRWQDLAEIVDDAMLDTFVPSGSYADVASHLRELYEGIADTLVFPMPDDPSEDADVAQALETLRA